MTQDECSLEQYMHKMSEVLRCPYTVQAVRPTRHWWRCPRVLAWFRVLMVWSLVKPPASGGPLSRIGDYLCAARGPGLFLRIRKRTTLPPKSAVTRGPPRPLFHRRCTRSHKAPSTAASIRTVMVQHVGCSTRILPATRSSWTPHLLHNAHKHLDHCGGLITSPCHC